VAVVGEVKETVVLLAAVVEAAVGVPMASLAVQEQPVKGMPVEPVTKQVLIIVLVVVVGQVLLGPLRQQVKVATVGQELLLQLLVVQ
jgi:hypothetical protein